MRSHLICLTLLMFLIPGASALPGQSTTPQALGLTLNLRPAEQGQLVLLEGVQVSNVEAFHSQAGRDHLRLQVTVGGTRYAAIEFNTAYTPALAAELQRRPVRLVGVWSSYQGQPSFTVLKVLNADTASTSPGTLLRIDGAIIAVPSIEKYTSAAHKVHVLYSFKVGARAFKGILYDGSWTSTTLNTLRSGHATLYGTWSEYQGQPSFVTTRVAP